jgi:hypothetical protein
MVLAEDVSHGVDLGLEINKLLSHLEDGGILFGDFLSQLDELLLSASRKTKNPPLSMRCRPLHSKKNRGERTGPILARSGLRVAPRERPLSAEPILIQPRHP